MTKLMSQNFLVVGVVLLGLTIAYVDTTDTETDIVYKYCKPWKWVSTATGGCKKCPGCKPGQYHDNSTLGPLDAVRGALECHDCRQCPKDKYSDKYTRTWNNLRYCRRNRNCTMKNRLYKWEPKQSRKSECGPCWDGYVRERHWDEDDGVCYKIEVTSSPSPEVTSSPDPEVTSSLNPEDNSTPKERKNKRGQDTVYGDHLESLERTVKSEGTKNRDHQQGYGITAVTITGLVLLALVFIVVGYIFQKKKFCFNISQDPVTNGAALGSSTSKTPLMVDGMSSQLSSPQQSAVHIGVPTVTTEKTNFSATKGSRVDLLSSVTGLSVHSVIWKRICEGSTTDLAVDNQRYGGSTVSDPSLRIFEVCPGDEGTYQCTAVNGVGTGSSPLCQLKVTANSDLEFTAKEIAKAKEIKLESVDDKMIKCLADVANDGKSKGHMMQKLYDHLKIAPHRVTQIREDYGDRGVRECVLQTLGYYVRKQGRTATVYSLYEALTACRFYYELQFYVQKFRQQLSDEEKQLSDEEKQLSDEEKDTAILMSDVYNETESDADDGQKASIDISVGNEQETAENVVVKIGVEDVTCQITVLDR